MCGSSSIVLNQKIDEPIREFYISITHLRAKRIVSLAQQKWWVNFNLLAKGRFIYII